jgi:hypothetical protein
MLNCRLRGLLRDPASEFRHGCLLGSGSVVFLPEPIPPEPEVPTATMSAPARAPGTEKGTPRSRRDANGKAKPPGRVRVASWLARRPSGFSRLRPSHANIRSCRGLAVPTVTTGPSLSTGNAGRSRTIRMLSGARRAASGATRPIRPCGSASDRDATRGSATRT